MLTLPPQGINILSSPPPSADVLESANQLIYVALNDQILREIQAGIAEGLSVTFGGKNAVSTSFPLSLNPLPSLLFALLQLRSRSLFSVLYVDG
jgi:hypothetical protein